MVLGHAASSPPVRSLVSRRRSNVYQGCTTAVALRPVPPAFLGVPGVQVRREPPVPHVSARRRQLIGRTSGVAVVEQRQTETGNLRRRGPSARSAPRRPDSAVAITDWETPAAGRTPVVTCPPSGGGSRSIPVTPRRLHEPRLVAATSPATHRPRPGSLWGSSCGERGARCPLRCFRGAPVPHRALRAQAAGTGRGTPRHPPCGDSEEAPGRGVRTPCAAAASPVGRRGRP